jgi:hypothetical protein
MSKGSKKSKRPVIIPPSLSPQKAKPEFGATSLYFNGISRQLITPVGLTIAFDTALYDGKPCPYKINNKKGLWDTGATGSVLTAAVVSELGLIPTGSTMVVTAGGTEQTNTYLVNIYLPNYVCVPGVPVSETKHIVGDFDVIIGMDIISKGDFAVTNYNSKTCMSFRIPSIQKIDYVIEANKITYAGVNKYEFCPCGAKDSNGKRIRFNECHGKGN